MISLLGESFLQSYGLIIILLIGLLVVMFILPNSARKKQYDQQQTFMSNLKVGDKVKTTSGFYGTIVSIRETTDGKVALLEMGEGSQVGYIAVDMNAIYTVDSKEDIVRDSDGNIISPADLAEPKEKVEEEKPAETDTKTAEDSVTFADAEDKEKEQPKKKKKSKKVDTE